MATKPNIMTRKYMEILSTVSNRLGFTYSRALSYSIWVGFDVYREMRNNVVNNKCSFKALYYFY